MSGALDTFTAGTAAPVDVAQIERQLRALWQQGGQTVSRACLFNLVVWCESETDRDRAGATIGELTSRHPCRAIVLFAEPVRAESSLDASIAAHCHLAGGGRKQVCCEQISLHAGGAAVSQLAPTVLSLLEGDLPTVLWWRGNFLDRADQFARMRGVADRIVFDSAQWPEPECWLAMLAAEVHEPVACLFADLSWTRLTLWRKLTADCFDEPAIRAVLPQLRRVTVSHGDGAGARMRALLYAGWVAMELGWPPKIAMERVMFRKCSGHDVADVGIESVELEADGALVRLQKNFAEHTATAVATLPELCSLPRKQAFAPLTEAMLMSQEFDHVAPHATYARALMLAATLAQTS